MLPALRVVVMVVMVLTLGLRTQIYLQCWFGSLSRLLFLGALRWGPSLSPQGSTVVVEKLDLGESSEVPGCPGHKGSSPGGASLSSLPPAPTPAEKAQKASDSSWELGPSSTSDQLCDPGPCHFPTQSLSLLLCKVGPF